MGKYYVESTPQWLSEISTTEYDEEFIRIIDFFLFHSPVPGQSARCKTLAEYGWRAPWKKPYWLNKQLKQSTSNYELLYTSNNQGCMEENLESANLKDGFPSNISIERICVVNNKNNQFMSVFYHLRDAFAHGRFNIEDVDGQKIFIMEDVASTKGEMLPVTGRMIIRKESLINWINIIEAGEKEYEDEKENER